MVATLTASVVLVLFVLPTSKSEIQNLLREMPLTQRVRALAPPARLRSTLSKNLPWLSKLRAPEPSRLHARSGGSARYSKCGLVPDESLPISPNRNCIKLRGGLKAFSLSPMRRCDIVLDAFAERQFDPDSGSTFINFDRDKFVQRVNNFYEKGEDLKCSLIP